MEDRSARASIAANKRWAFCENRSAATLPARLALEDKWLREVDPDGTLPPAERATRAKNLRAAHYKRMALKSAQVRRRSA
jgi:hypothetical protein